MRFHNSYKTNRDNITLYIFIYKNMVITCHIIVKYILKHNNIYIRIKQIINSHYLTRLEHANVNTGRSKYDRKYKLG